MLLLGPVVAYDSAFWLKTFLFTLTLRVVPVCAFSLSAITIYPNRRGREADCKQRAVPLNSLRRAGVRNFYSTSNLLRPKIDDHIYVGDKRKFSFGAIEVCASAEQTLMMLRITQI